MQTARCHVGYVFTTMEKNMKKTLLMVTMLVGFTSNTMASEACSWLNDRYLSCDSGVSFYYAGNGIFMGSDDNTYIVRGNDIHKFHYAGNNVYIGPDGNTYIIQGNTIRRMTSGEKPKARAKEPRQIRNKQDFWLGIARSGIGIMNSQSSDPSGWIADGFQYGFFGD